MNRVGDYSSRASRSKQWALQEMFEGESMAGLVRERQCFLHAD